MPILWWGGAKSNQKGDLVFGRSSLQLRRGGDLPLRRQLPWLAAFGFAYAATGWLDMFLVGEMDPGLNHILKAIRMVLQPTSGLLLLIFGWGVLTKITPSGRLHRLHLVAQRLRL